MNKLNLSINTSNDNGYNKDSFKVPPLTRVNRMSMVEQKIMESIRMKNLKRDKYSKK